MWLCKAYVEGGTVLDAFIDLILPHLYNVLGTIDRKPLTSANILESHVGVFSIGKLDDDAGF